MGGGEAQGRSRRPGKALEADVARSVYSLLAPLAEKRMSHPPNAFESLSGLLERIQPRGSTVSAEAAQVFADRVDKGVVFEVVADDGAADYLIKKLRKTL